MPAKAVGTRVFATVAASFVSAAIPPSSMAFALIHPDCFSAACCSAAVISGLLGDARRGCWGEALLRNFIAAAATLGRGPARLPLSAVGLPTCHC